MFDFPHCFSLALPTQVLERMSHILRLTLRCALRVLKWLERLGMRPERTEPAAHLEAVDLGSVRQCVFTRESWEALRKLLPSVRMGSSLLLPRRPFVVEMNSKSEVLVFCGSDDDFDFVLLRKCCNVGGLVGLFVAIYVCV